MNVLLFADRNPRAAIAVLRGLRTTDAKVHVALSNPKNRRSFTAFARAGRVNPHPLKYDASAPEGLVESLTTIRKAIGPYVIFPLGEEILRWCIRDRDSLATKEIEIPTVDIATYEQISNKFSFVEFANQNGLDVPIQYDQIPDSFESQFVVKPRDGAKQEGILDRPMLVESLSILQTLRGMAIDQDRHFIQEYLGGPSYYYCAIYDEGTKKLDFTQQTIVQQPNGMSVIKAAPSTLPSDIILKIDQMFGHLAWHGVMMLEMKRSDDNRYCAIECNPRFWGPLQLALDNGVNFPKALLQLALHRPVDSRVNVQNPIGYLWSTGFLHGACLKSKTGAKFQVFEGNPDERIRYRDVWFRLDTLLYAVIEPVFIISPMAALSRLLRRIKTRLLG